TTEKLDAEWETRGLLFVFLTPEGFDHYHHTDHLLREYFGMNSICYDSQQLTDLEPALKPDLAGGFHYTSDAHLRPDRLITSWRKLLCERGLEILEHCDFHSFIQRGNQAAAARTSAGDKAADTFIIASGAWTPRLNIDLGCKIPIQPGKGYSLTMP